MTFCELGIWFLHNRTPYATGRRVLRTMWWQTKTNSTNIFYPCAWAQTFGAWDVHWTTSNGPKRRQPVNWCDKINDIENQPKWAGWFADALRVTQDTMWHCVNLISRSHIFSELYMFGSGSDKFPDVPSHSGILDGQSLFLACQGMFPKKRCISQI